MFNPVYRILITNKFFTQENFICLGTQLIFIINSIKDFLPSHIWFGTDVDATRKSINNYNLNSTQLNIIGTDSQFAKYCSTIEQFIWGEFLCIDTNFSFQNFQNIKLVTEDEPFRPIPCKGVLIEIRTFDTTFFEIFSEDIELMKNLSKIFNVEIEKNKLSKL